MSPSYTITPLLGLDVASRRVLVRADLDGPRSPYGAVLDDSPLRAVLPTLRALREARARIIIAARLTTTQNEIGIPRTVAQSLGELLDAKVGVLDTNFAAQLRMVGEGQIVLTPNLESIPEDAANDPAWAAAVARSVDVYVLDGVRAAGESSASVVAIPRLVAERGAGTQVTAALDAVRAATLAPPKPYTLVLGGASVMRVLPIATALLPVCTDIVVGGTVGNTFLAARGWRPGGSSYEPSALFVVNAFTAAAGSAGVRIHSPSDVIMSRAYKDGSRSFSVQKIDRAFLPEEAAVDVAIETCVAYTDVLTRSATALWVGLMGDCSIEETQSGSVRVGQAAARVRRTVLAGEDTLAASRFFGLADRFQVLSGGDAALRLLTGDTLPGLEALKR
ncbi:MAG TPA: phosphoglycerate kinase [Polyangiaceae bacterium]